MTSDETKGHQGIENPEPWADLVARWCFVAGVLIFLANMIVAWWVVCSSKNFISQPLLSDQAHQNGLSQWLQSASRGSANQLVFGNRMAEMEVHLKAMANQQTTVIVGMAASFSFVAIGFALFVMGIRSAFTLSGQSGPNHRLVLSAASPGILCFVLSAAIMVFALSRPIQLQLGGFTVQPDSPGRQDQEQGSALTPTEMEILYPELHPTNE